MELYTLSRDEVLGTRSTRRDPEEFQIHREDCKRFFPSFTSSSITGYESSRQTSRFSPWLLSVLSPLEKPSASSLRLLMTPPHPLDDKIVSLGGHTDIGTIVMLFHVVGSFQVLPAGSENISSNWPYVRSVPECALINIVDSFVEWTGGLLRSTIHRVVTPPEKKATCTRRSLAYLIRPDHNGSMRRLQINGISQLAEDEEVESCSVDKWAAWRAQ